MDLYAGYIIVPLIMIISAPSEFVPFGSLTQRLARFLVALRVTIT
jgi:hypothetical protein